MKSNNKFKKRASTKHTFCTFYRDNNHNFVTFV